MLLRPEDNPPSLPSGIKSVSQLTGDWWVAFTKARNEKAFAWDMHRIGVGYFLPLCDYVVFSGGRTRHGRKLLFPSYVFICGDPQQRHRALATNRLSTVTPVSDREQFVTEIVNIERAIESKATLDVHPFISAGNRARIHVGPLAEVEGIVVQQDGMTRLVLLVTAIGAARSLEVSPAALLPIA